MPFTLPRLPYATDALAPVMSKELVELHYEKHHRGYIEKLNKLVADTELEARSLEDLIVNIQAGDIFNNAAQAWNHAFFWKCVTPGGVSLKSGKLRENLERQFGSFDNFVGQFADAAEELFGSGWVWLVRLANGALSIESTHNADNPLTHGHSPLLGLDVWEHAYYIDYQNERGRFVEAFWNIVNWDYVSAQFDRLGPAGKARLKTEAMRSPRSRQQERRYGGFLNSPQDELGAP